MDDAEHYKWETRRRHLLVAGVLVLIAAVCMIIALNSEAVDNTQQLVTAEDTTAVDYIQNVVDVAENPMEAEEINIAVPLSCDLQDTMKVACVKYGCPYPLALAVAEVESRFDMDAVGAVGEVGIMQLNPGPSGSYHADLETATGQDPTTPSGNIVCGVYQLGKYIEKYKDLAKAAMAYNMGESGARKAWSIGIADTEYSNAVIEATKKWECQVHT